MIPEHIRERVALFHKDKYRLLNANEVIELKEKKREGRATIHCQCDRDFLVLPTPENNVLPYLDEQISGARSCADVFLFASNGMQWDLHVFELKKTINTSTFAKSKEQFRMGIWNARAVAAFLGMDIGDVVLHVAFRTEQITNLFQANLIQIRASNNQQVFDLMKEWKKEKVLLKTDSEEREYLLQKIQLNQEGNGSIFLTKTG